MILHNDWLEVGDYCTISGCYVRRTFWQLITMKPKKLVQYRVVNVHNGYSELGDITDNSPQSTDQ